MRWFLGFLLIIIGIIYLGNTFSWWNVSDFAVLWRYWPLLLIIFGIAIIVRRFRFGWIIVLLALIASVFFVYYSIKNNKFIGQTSTTISNQGEKAYPISEDLPESVKQAEVTINSSAVKFNLNERSDKLVEGNLTSNIFEPDVNKKINGDTAQLDIKIDSQNFRWNSRKIINDLSLKLTDKLPLDLKINASASDMTLDFSKLNLSSLKIDSGASNIDLTLGENIGQNMPITIDAGASSLNIKLPKNLEAEANFKSALSSRDLEGFKKISSGKYQTEGFNSASKRVIINLNAGASSVSLRRGE